MAAVVPPRIGSYEVGRTLGEGRFAKVKFGRHINSGTAVAIKIIRKDRFHGVDKLVKQEIAAMKRINHPHVVKLIEVLASKQNVYIILEYVSGGELLEKIRCKEQLLQERRNGHTRSTQRLVIEYFHSAPMEVSEASHQTSSTQGVFLDRVVQISSIKCQRLR